jgi:hypothetical protein
MKIIRYNDSSKAIWNEFVKNSKNGIFMFDRNYMDYHSDRFIDHSLMIYNDKDKLIALLPANIVDNTLHSHQGLTFGGFITDKNMHCADMLDIFDEFKSYAKENKISKMIYKAIPHTYHKMSAEEDIYALFRNNAKVIRCDSSACIFNENTIKFSKSRKWSIKKAEKSNISVKFSNDFDKYYEILSETLKSKHDAKPTHSLEELKLLASRFPENIKLIGAFQEEKMLAGSILFIYDNIVHTQYLANSEEGRDIGALDKVIDFAIKEYSTSKKYFDFGISNEDSGRILNRGLMQQKEQFGARTIAHNFFEINF